MGVKKSMICMLFQEIAEEKKISRVIGSPTAQATLTSHEPRVLIDDISNRYKNKLAPVTEKKNSRLISFFPSKGSPIFWIQCNQFPIPKNILSINKPVNLCTSAICHHCPKDVKHASPFRIISEFATSKHKFFASNSSFTSVIVYGQFCVIHIECEFFFMLEDVINSFSWSTSIRPFWKDFFLASMNKNFPRGFGVLLSIFKSNFWFICNNFFYSVQKFVTAQNKINIIIQFPRIPKISSCFLIAAMSA